MSGRSFTSAFAEDLDAYLAFKQAMGFSVLSRAWYLGCFDAYCSAHDLAVFDKETVEGWVIVQLGRSGSSRSWMSYIRDFGRWLRAQGHGDAYVLSERWKAPFVPPHPYLLSQSEIESFFATASELQTRSPWRWQAAAFFTLMHSCGLRTGEVRSLLRRQVDFDRGHIDIVWSKANRSRRLPLTEEVVDVLAVCERTTREHFGGALGHFFVSASGNEVTAATVGKVFADIWDQAGLARPVGGQRPRPYDFRHHFAYANVERWMRNGDDVAAMLPYLSRYMGHAAFESTYYYVHTSPDFMNTYAQVTEAVAVFPQVGFA